jgi:cell division protein FtsQ
MWKVGLVAIVIAAGTTGTYALTRTSAFGLARIDVLGVHTLTRADVVDASGLSLGENVLSLDLSAIAARIRALPGVSDAAVTRVGSVGISIVVTERTAAATVVDGAHRWAVDSSGAAVGASPPNVPVITFARPTADDEVAALAAAAPTVRNVTIAWTEIPQSVRARIVTFFVRSDGALRFAMGRTIVDLGTPEATGAKCEALTAILARSSADGARLSLVDVSDPGHPVARLG